MVSKYSIRIFVMCMLVFDKDVYHEHVLFESVVGFVYKYCVVFMLLRWQAELRTYFFINIECFETYIGSAYDVKPHPCWLVSIVYQQYTCCVLLYM
jgi:hypothetical protein